MQDAVLKIREEIGDWLAIRFKARENKDFEVADAIRVMVERIYGIEISDTKAGVTYHWRDND